MQQSRRVLFFFFSIEPGGEREKNSTLRISLLLAAVFGVFSL